MIDGPYPGATGSVEVHRGKSSEKEIRGELVFPPSSLSPALVFPPSFLTCRTDLSRHLPSPIRNLFLSSSSHISSPAPAAKQRKEEEAAFDRTLKRTDRRVQTTVPSSFSFCFLPLEARLFHHLRVAKYPSKPQTDQSSSRTVHSRAKQGKSSPSQGLICRLSSLPSRPSPAVDLLRLPSPLLFKYVQYLN